MKKIEIEIREIKLENGKTFNSVTAYQKDGKKIRAHFRKEVNNLPKECGRYFFLYPDQQRCGTSSAGSEDRQCL